MDLNSEKGASSWLSVLPISGHGFALHKGAFHDAICLRYKWHPPHLPSRCVCGSSFNTDHALTCPTGGFPSVRHKDLRDFTANLLSEICSNVCIEPPLQALTGELLSHDTSNSEDGARLDVSTQGFWGDRHHRAFLMYVFSTQMLPPIGKCSYHQHIAFVNTKSRGLMTNVYGK